MNNKEKVYFIIAIILFVALGVKSFYFDEVKTTTKEEAMFKEYVYKLIEEKYNGFLSENNIRTFRVVKIKKISNEGTSIIQVKEDNKYKEIEIKGKYKAKVRKYLFNIMPYGEKTISSRE